MKTLTLIPCYNHGQHLPTVVGDVRKYCSDVLVVDDGSNDGSDKIVDKIDNIYKIKHTVNQGKGSALKTGFKFALEKGFDAVITVDSDGQHKGYHIPDFIKEGLDNHLVIGSRMNNLKNMPPHRIFSNKFSSYLISWKAGQPIFDSQSGYRLYQKDLIKKLKLNNNCYQMETELILKTAKAGYKIGHVPIDTIYEDQKSHIKPLHITYEFFKALINN